MSAVIVAVDDIWNFSLVVLRPEIMKKPKDVWDLSSMEVNPFW